MPRIPEYFSSENITPTDRGANAWENAARRISGFYNSTASNERATGRQLGAFFDKEASSARESGQLDARAFKQQLWPFDMQELYERRALRAAQEAAEASSGPRGGSGGVRVRGDVNPLETAERKAERANSRASGETNESLANRGGSYGAVQIARGAGAIGGMMSDGGRQASQRVAGDGREPPEALTYEGGQLMTVSAARRAQIEYNTATEKQIEQYSNDLSEYQQRYHGVTRPPAGSGDGVTRPGYPMTGSYTGAGGAFVPDASNPTAQYAPAKPDPFVFYNPTTWFGPDTYNNLRTDDGNYGSNP